MCGRYASSRGAHDLVDAFEVERRRIERDLHDGAQQRLVALSMQLGLARLELADGSAAATQVAAAQQLAKETLAELRDAWTAHGRIALAAEAYPIIDASAQAVQAIVAKGDAAYGINTGFGLLATLIAQVAMFKNLGGDASVIGNALAIALTGTLYGCMLQNLIAGPIAECLRGLDRSDFERAKDAIRNAAEPYRVDGGFVLPALALCAFGVR